MTAERIAELRKLDDDEVDQRDMCEALDEITRLQRENAALRGEHQAWDTYFAVYGKFASMDIAYTAHRAAAEALMREEPT